MIDQDGIERPDSPDEHMLEIKHDTKKVQFDENYSFRPRNPFFKIWASIFRAIAICFFYPFMKIKYKLKIIGKENLKKLKKQAFIMTCNHVHVFDDVAIGTNVFPFRKIYFTTLDRNIRRPCVGFFLRSLGGIPIPVESLSGMKKFNADINYLLKKGKPVLYNPESAMWPYYRGIRPFKRGAFVMAAKNDVPVLPIVVTFKRKPKKNGKYKYQIYYTISQPIVGDRLLPEKVLSESLMNQTYEVTKKIIDDFYQEEEKGYQKKTS